MTWLTFDLLVVSGPQEAKTDIIATATVPMVVIHATLALVETGLRVLFWCDRTVNWNAYHPEESIRRFADRGFQQIISLPMGSTQETLQRMVVAARSQPGILGYQYTSWVRDYSDIPLFDRLTADRGAP